MSRRVQWRKLMLTAHISASVGWLGAIVAFLAIATVALIRADDTALVSAAGAMETIGWSVIVPFSVACLLSGLLQSWITHWGFFRHYWVIAKLLISVAASGLLLLHMRIVDSIAVAASTHAVSDNHLHGPQQQVVADAAGAIVALLIAVALSVYKPRGRTDAPAPRWVKVTGLLVVLGLFAVAARHAAGGGMQSHFQ